MNLTEHNVLSRNNIIYEAALPAWSAASNNAKVNGVPYGITITTTPNNVDTRQGAYAKLFIDNAAKWRLECFDMTDSELDEYIEKNSENSFLHVEFTYKELGHSDKWLKTQLRLMQGNMAKIKREVLLEWPRSTETSVFSEEQLDKIFEFLRDPVTSIFVNGYAVDFFETPDLKVNYILSCDVAGGLSRDRSVITIIAPDDFRVVGEFVSNVIDTDSFRELIKELMHTWFRNAILIVERNSYGLNIVHNLMKDRIIEPRMFREERVKKGEKTQKDGFTVKKNTKAIVYGVETNRVTRNQMFDMLPEIVDYEYDKIVSRRLYKDIQTLEKKPNGKIEHAEGEHDDNLMSYLIFRWALHFGTNMQKKFKISPMPSTSNVKTVSSSEDIRRIESIIGQANKMDDLASVNTQAFDYIRERTEKLQENKSRSALINQILDLNK